MFLFFFVGCFLVFVFLVFLWGFKGQVRWPEGPPHLALNPPYLFFCVFVVVFLLLFPLSFRCILIQISVFPLEKGIFCLFLSLSLCFSLALFGLTLFQFLFLCLSLSLSLPLSCSFILFLPCFFFAFFWLLRFVSFFPSVSSCLCFMEGTTLKHLTTMFFSSTFCHFGGFSVLFYL